MHLLLLNGSPRGKTGNTRILLDALLEGFAAVDQSEQEVEYLNRVDSHPELAERFWARDAVVLGFPLYVDAMPARVKLFIERLGACRPGADAPRPRLGFLVQSGFVEASHSRRVERYLAKLAARLGCPYAGCIVKGGCEGLRIMPPLLTLWTRRRMRRFGMQLARDGAFDPALLSRFASPERLGPLRRAWWNVGSRLFNVNMYWDSQLRKHDAFAQRFARPYEGQWPTT